MKKSNIKVEQIYNDNVKKDYSEILTKNEMNKILLSIFSGSILTEDKTVYGEYNGKKYCIFSKNISYLGNPHPLFKKRIQIPNEFIDLYEKNNKNKIKTLLIGIYKYKDNILLCDFDTKKYVVNKAHNSSAHVYTIDLLNGYRNGIFKKKDYRGNIITVFNIHNIEKYLKMKLDETNSSGVKIFDTMDDFFYSLLKDWVGIDCYIEMIKYNYRNKFQPEWPGFYLEFKLEKYLEKNHKDDIIRYAQDKKNGGIDLDLYFPELNMYGDLKAHSSSSTAIQGNDLDTIIKLIETQSVYYIVCNHDTEKDKNHDYQVTEFWNKAQKKSNLRSYGEKMKYSVKITSYSILEINKYNKKYLKIFKQGKNSNGKKRKPKIMIPEEYVDNFLVHTVDFSEEIN